MTKIINLFGGPGSGKSTTASGLFHYFKTKTNISTELVTEYAKDIVYEGTDRLLGNQLHVFSEQFRRQWRLIDKVEFVITDSPILLSSVYFELYFNKREQAIFSPKYKNKSIEFFDCTFKEFENINFFINRSKKFDPKGRVQNEEESRALDDIIKNKLIENNISFKVINYENSVDEILKELINI